MSDIRKRVGKNGTTYQVRYPSTATRSGYAYKTFDTLKAARAWIESGGAKLQGEKSLTQIQTVAEGLQTWLDVCEKEGRGGRDPVTPYTLKTYRYRADIISSYDWEKPLQELTSPDIVAFRSWLLRNHSRDQARKVLSYFHSMVIEMVNRGAIPYDIAAGIRVSKTSRYDEPVNIPSVSEIQALLDAADRLANSENAQIQRTWERYRPLLYLAVDSGMRPQEYLVAGRSSLRKTGIEVDRALDAGGKTISVTKTRAGRRLIDLSPETLDMVRHYLKHHSIPNKHDLIFPTSNGKWLSTNNWRRRGFLVACREAGLIDHELSPKGQVIEVPKYKPYDLRHFYASMLIESRVNLKKIQRLMGHSDIQTTLNVYGHVIERAEDDAASSTSVLSKMADISCGKSVARAL